MVENHGNTVASCRLHLVDPTDRVDGDFDPPAVGVAPGAANLVRLKTRAHRGGFRRHARTLDFEIEAGRQGHAPVTAKLIMVQSPTIPAGTLARAAGAVAILGALVLAWFGLVKPTIEDAVAEEAASQVVSTVPAGQPDPTPDESDDPDPGGEPTVTAGEPSFFRLEVAAPLTQAASESTTMPDGEIFDMTDVRIENPYNDTGVATLLVNDQQVFIWSLDNVRGSFFEPRITPIRLAPGDNVAFSVRCDEIGDASRPTCTTAVNVGGLVTPAP
jgi:hypothetical protein